MSMNCEDIERLSDAYADGELDLERTVALEAHVSTCEACAARLARIRGIRQALRTVPYFRAPEALAARIRTTVADAAAATPPQQPRSLRTRRRTWRPWVLSAASLLGVARGRGGPARTHGHGR